MLNVAVHKWNGMLSVQLCRCGICKNVPFLRLSQRKAYCVCELLMKTESKVAASFADIIFGQAKICWVVSIQKA